MKGMRSFRSFLVDKEEDFSQPAISNKSMMHLHEEKQTYQTLLRNFPNHRERSSLIILLHPWKGEFAFLRISFRKGILQRKTTDIWRPLGGLWKQNNQGSAHCHQGKNPECLHTSSWKTKYRFFIPHTTISNRKRKSQRLSRYRKESLNKLANKNKKPDLRALRSHSIT